METKYWQLINSKIFHYLVINGSVDVTDTALYRSSLPSITSSTSDARNNDTLDARQ